MALVWLERERRRSTALGMEVCAWKPLLARLTEDDLLDMEERPVQQAECEGVVHYVSMHYVSSQGA